MYHVLCIMYCVLYIMYYVLCIMNYVLCIIRELIVNWSKIELNRSISNGRTQKCSPFKQSKDSISGLDYRAVFKNCDRLKDEKVRQWLQGLVHVSISVKAPKIWSNIKTFFTLNFFSAFMNFSKSWDRCDPGSFPSPEPHYTLWQKLWVVKRG